MAAHLLLLLLFLLTVGHLVTLKLCSVRLDHRTAPIFISVWMLAGLLLSFPAFGHLWVEGLEKFSAQPWMLALSVVKGCALYLVFVISQKLMQESLSSRHYVTPMTVGLVAVGNAILGEMLTPLQWASAMGLCLLSAVFFFKGHLSSLSPGGKRAYVQLVILSSALSCLDFTLTKNINWYSLLLVSNMALLALCVVMNAHKLSVFRQALLHKYAALAGSFYVVTEMVKFYQLVTINPVSVVVTVQAATKPVILVLSALVWKERTLKEQITWGVLAFLITLPLFF